MKRNSKDVDNVILKRPRTDDPESSTETVLFDVFRKSSVERVSYLKNQNVTRITMKSGDTLFLTPTGDPTIGKYCKVVSTLMRGRADSWMYIGNADAGFKDLLKLFDGQSTAPAEDSKE